MDSKEVLYAKWLSGEITDAEFQALEGAGALAEMKRIVQATDKLAMPIYDVESGYAKYQKRHQKTPTKVRRLNWMKLSGIAASFLILIFVGSKLLLNQTRIEGATSGQNHQLALNDGSNVWLNDGSTVEYNSRKWNDQRTIELKGEAHFEVTKGSPFTVNTQHGSIQVLGTQFNVRTWGDNLLVECYEGKVQVTAGDQEVILTANEGVSVLTGSMGAKQSITHQQPQWKHGISRFQNENLQEVFAELERQYAITVEAKDIERLFSGSFRHDDLDAALRGICKPLDLNYTTSADEKTVIIE